MDKLSRRGFLKRSGAAVGGIVVGGVAVHRGVAAAPPIVGVDPARPGPDKAVVMPGWESFLAPDHLNWITINTEVVRVDPVVAGELDRGWRLEEGLVEDGVSYSIYQRRRPHMSGRRTKVSPGMIWNLVKW